MTAADRDSGLYVLLIHLPRSRNVIVGRLGRVVFQNGFYLYVGSARRRRSSRVMRHVAPKKTLHWHIDYLTTSPAAVPLGVVLFGGAAGECELNQRVGAIEGVTAPIQRFGSSDCRALCRAHLWYRSARISAVEIQLELGHAHESRAYGLNAHNGRRSGDDCD